MHKIIKTAFLLLSAMIPFSCNKFIDVVPDNVATIDFAFRLRSQAEKALFTCYSYLPNYGSEDGNVGFLGGDEIWTPPNYNSNAKQIALGNQKVVEPYMTFWTGSNGGKDLYEGIRQCNIFLDNIHKVPNMDQSEKKRWSAEVKFLKAYYHFYLIRMYGPIILIKKNLPVSAGREEVQKPRDPVDSCFSYVIELLNEVIATPELPGRIQKTQRDLGRITKSIAYAIRAKVWVTWASPLFNGNKDYVGYTNINGENPFNTEYDPARWDSAAVACKQAINFCESVGYQLYEFTPPLSTAGLNDSTIQKMTIRQSLTLGQGLENSGAIWVDPGSKVVSLQKESIPYGINPEAPVNSNAVGRLAPPLKIAEMFYTNHGLPITADKTWDYSQRLNLREVASTSRFNMHEGYTTAYLNFHREPRFYADLGFDGGIWYGSGVYSDSIPESLTYIRAKYGQPNANHDRIRYSVTGYWTKKLVNYQTMINAPAGWHNSPYSWPVFRLADLYLLYAEAKNEADGPGPEVYDYINRVRERAGIPKVQDAWSQWSNDPDKYMTKEGMREIIHRERLIELAFEGQRFWDLRRWKEAIDKLNKPITGWDIDQETSEGYYREQIIFQQHFTTKDYFWPLSEINLLSNSKLTQNPGW